MTKLIFAFPNFVNAPKRGYECGVDKLSEEEEEEEEGDSRSPQKKKSQFLGGFRKEIPLLLLLLFFRVSLASSTSEQPVPLATVFEPNIPGSLFILRQDTLAGASSLVR